MDSQRFSGAHSLGSSYIVIGDVHGCAAQLRMLLGKERLFVGRRAVFLGDYVDVGVDSPGVIEALLGFRVNRPESVFLRGNHEVEMLQFLRDGDFVRYARRGGLSTIRAYVGVAVGDVVEQFRCSLPQAHREFLQATSIYFETADCLFSHCGYSPDQPMDRGVDAMVLQSHPGLFEGARTLGKMSICGHYFQQTLVPYVSEDVICLDSGCGILAGPLSALLMPERVLVQISASLECVTRDNWGVEVWCASE